MKNHKITLTEGEDFTITGLTKFLNKKYEGKKTGKPFMPADIHQYVLRNRLPEEYGGHPLQVSSNEVIGIKILKVDFNTQVPNKKRNS